MRCPAGAYAVVVTKQGWRPSSSSAPREKGRDIIRRRTLYLPALLVALVLLACAAAVLAVSKEAEATFPRQNVNIAVLDDGGLSTNNPDGK
jgi:hypothetical protein